jgi:nitrite reductase/ring-hydroxylating ferredoxin subunit
MARHPILKLSDLPPGSRKIVKVAGIEIGLFNVAGQVHAYCNVCPHGGAPVCVGKVTGTTLPSRVYEYDYGLDGCILRCPWHGWEFDLRTGEHLVDPETRLKKIRVESDGNPATGLENLDRFPVESDGDFLCVVLPGGNAGVQS